MASLTLRFWRMISLLFGVIALLKEYACLAPGLCRSFRLAMSAAL